MFITPAYAQAAGDTASLLSSLIPFVLIFGIMWFLLIRPQQKKAKEHRSMIEALRRTTGIGGSPWQSISILPAP